MSEVEEIEALESEQAEGRDSVYGSDAGAAPRPRYQTGDEVDADGFVHLAVHSEFSLSDGLVKVKDLAARVAELDMPAVALTDRANLFGLVKFYKACREAGVKPVVGAELDYEDADGGGSRCRLLVASKTGYNNLLSLVSAAYTASPSDAAKSALAGLGGRQGAAHGRVCRQALLAAADGLIVLLGTGSDVGAAIGADDAASAKRRLSEWQQAFGDRVYLEVVRTGREGEDRFVADAVGLAAAAGAPVVACNDVRFLAPDDFEAHETRVCIQEGRVLNDPRRERHHTVEQYLRTPDEMVELFRDVPEALANTVEIAKRCSLELVLGEPSLPEPPIDKGATSESLLATRAREGLERHLQSLAESSAEVDRGPYDDRLDYELDIITKMGFAGYFLIVEEFVTWARANAVPVGCRGSGTASLVAFCVGITELDPLKYDLLFERLLNPERVSLPDFDIDVCMERRGEALAHVADLYGHDAVSQIATFGTMAARAVVRDVARVQDKPFGLADRLSKMIPAEVGMTLSKAVDQEQELADFIARNEDAQEIMDMAYKLEGTVRNVGKHAGGVVISPTTLIDFVPLYADHSGGTVVSQFDLYDVEEAGLVKFDFLGLRTLTIIDWAVSAINAEREETGADAIDLENVPLDDTRTYEFLKTAHTTAVFQLESAGMKELVARLKPDSIEDIIALVALFRPGPLQSGAVDDYVERKHGRAAVRYPHPRLEGALAGTYGVMLYQEQVMTMAQLLAGFTLGEADLLRRAMSKKKPEEMAKMRATFLEGTTKEGVDPRVANDIFDQVEKFAGYAFNKAHAAGYALLAFRTAYLKAHYPAHFMSAVLSADMDKIEKVVPLVDEVRRMGLDVLPPDVNRSAFRFRAAEAGIRYGLGAVRGVGAGPVETLVRERGRGGPFRDLDDFCMRVDLRRVNKRLLEALVRAGAMDCFASPGESIDSTRARLLDELPDAVQGAEQSARNAELAIDDMFGGVPKPSEVTNGRKARALSKHDRLEGERETLGLFLTGHPVDEYLPEIRRFCRTPIAELRPADANQTAVGVVVSNRTRRGRRGAMGFVEIDDRSGRIEANLFGEVYDRYRAKLEKHAILVIEGTVQSDEFTQGHKLRAERVMTLDEARKHHAGRIVLRTARQAIDPGTVADLKTILGRHRNADGCSVAVDYVGAGACGCVVLGDAWRVDATDALLGELRDAFGEDAVDLGYGS
ncbi:MAG: DNA polymerase III subunit alpha [Gammaproteobacteria bacterium]|nr:DNA polymerase III subunit alpha [Gammaproteobacteria bacterium]